jgi:hypothetical protein
LCSKICGAPKFRRFLDPLGSYVDGKKQKICQLDNLSTAAVKTDQKCKTIIFVVLLLLPVVEKKAKSRTVASGRRGTQSDIRDERYRTEKGGVHHYV